jgi:hypothetical protein
MIALPRLGPTANDNVDVTSATLAIVFPSFVVLLIGVAVWLASGWQ